MVKTGIEDDFGRVAQKKDFLASWPLTSPFGLLGQFHSDLIWPLHALYKQSQRFEGEYWKEEVLLKLVLKLALTLTLRQKGNRKEN
jgi:hypothetical protein